MMSPSCSQCYPHGEVFWPIDLLMHNGEAIRGITHWMPLPQSPSGHGE